MKAVSWAIRPVGLSRPSRRSSCSVPVFSAGRAKIFVDGEGKLDFIADKPQMNMTLKVSIALSAGILLLGSTPVRALELRGSIYNDWYAFRQLDTTHVRSYLGARGTLIAWRGRHDRTLEFHTNLRWAGDLSHRQGLGPQVFVYETYARLANIPKGLEFSLGRQFSFNGIQSLLLDGVRARYSPITRLQLDLFGGVTALSSDPEKIQTISNAGVAGGRIAYSITSSFRAGVSALTRKSEGYGASSQFGLDLDKEIGRWNLYTKAAFNHTQSRLADFLARVVGSPPKLVFCRRVQLSAAIGLGRQHLEHY